jgi:hypothetical protein
VGYITMGLAIPIVMIADILMVRLASTESKHPEGAWLMFVFLNLSSRFTDAF